MKGQLNISDSKLYKDICKIVDNWNCIQIITDDNKLRNLVV